MSDSVTTTHEKAVRAFTWHAVVFAIVNLIQIVINLVKSPKRLWFQWVLLDWGVGLGTHAWLVYRASEQHRADQG